ncbi:15891_t:CDS:2 [Rhizophagus irregularis]|nr:15891_t:CDS:2 [Rhizophagus irregularis]
MLFEFNTDNEGYSEITENNNNNETESQSSKSSDFQISTPLSSVSFYIDNERKSSISSDVSQTENQTDKPPPSSSVSSNINEDKSVNQTENQTNTPPPSSPVSSNINEDKSVNQTENQTTICYEYGIDTLDNQVPVNKGKALKWYKLYQENDGIHKVSEYISNIKKELEQ